MCYNKWNLEVLRLLMPRTEYQQAVVLWLARPVQASYDCSIQEKKRMLGRDLEKRTMTHASIRELTWHDEAESKLSISLRVTL
jgi:hypothetical protein